jgi:hypothetical protein
MTTTMKTATSDPRQRNCCHTSHPRTERWRHSPRKPHPLATAALLEIDGNFILEEAVAAEVTPDRTSPIPTGSTSPNGTPPQPPQATVRERREPPGFAAQSRLIVGSHIWRPRSHGERWKPYLRGGIDDDRLWQTRRHRMVSDRSRQPAMLFLKGKSGPEVHNYPDLAFSSSARENELRAARFAAILHNTRRSSLH